MLEHDLHESVGFWIIMAAEAYQQALNEKVAPHGITYRQCQVLGCLALDGPLSQCELAERMHIEPPTLVGILDRMERDGWIRRAGCQQDRRKKLVYPTAEAKPVWSKIIACGRRVREQATHGLSEDERETLRNLLNRVQENLRTEQPAKQLV